MMLIKKWLIFMKKYEKKDEVKGEKEKWRRGKQDSEL
jgi:hypothetical protein